MYITPALIDEAENLYGVPREARMTAPVREEEWDFIRRTQRRGRAHDVTLIIFHPDAATPQIAVINKHGYPEGLFRPPSGGLDPGESFANGAGREAFEETGLTIALRRYILRVFVDFNSPTRTLPWTTHVFTAHAENDKIVIYDTKEIRDARWATLSVFDDFRKRSPEFDRGGVQYRRALHDEIMRELPRSSHRNGK